MGLSLPSEGGTPSRQPAGRRRYQFLYTSFLMPSLQSAIERLATLGEVEGNPDARKTFLEFREQLTQGKIRAAEKINR